MATVASLRHNPKLKSFYNHLIANHKPPKAALVPVIRKLLAFMHAVIKNNSFWDDSFTIVQIFYLTFFTDAADKK